MDFNIFGRKKQLIKENIWTPQHTTRNMRYIENSKRKRESWITEGYAELNKPNNKYIALHSLRKLERDCFFDDE